MSTRPKKRRWISLKAASYAEAERRICAVLDPYLEKLHVVYDSGTRQIVSELKERLCEEFEDFGFEEIPLDTTGDDE